MTSITRSQAATSTAYAAPLRALHWTTAAIWIASWIIAFAGVHWRDALNTGHQLTFWHKALASTVIFLTLFRIASRFAYGAPALPASMSTLAQRAAHWGHIGIYALALIALPLSGWFWSSVADKPIMMLGLIKLPPLVAPDKSLYDTAKMIHTYAAWACGGLILGHIGAAVKHQLVDRDGIMLRMLSPRRK